MPSPTVSKRRGSMIRQLSLQGQGSRGEAGRRGLKKQLSEDEGRRRAEEEGGSPLRIGSAGEGARVREHRELRETRAARPRPVKLAWADRRQDSGETPTEVEIVARKCQGQPRPVTAKPQRLTNLPLLGDKDTLVYTRQQLAERLRRAWKEREKNRPNLDIFLAQGGEEGVSSARSEEHSERGEAGLSGLLDVSARSDTLCVSPHNRRRAEPVRALSIEPANLAFKPTGVKLQTNCFGTNKPRDVESKIVLKPSDLKTDFKKKPFPEKSLIARQTSTEGVRQLQEQNKIEIRVAGSEPQNHPVANNEIAKNPALADLLDFKTFPVADASKKFGTDFATRAFQMKSIELPDKPPLKTKHSRNKENMGSAVTTESPRSDSSYSECSKMGKMDEAEPPLTASARRASFRSSNMLNKTITGSFSSVQGSSVELEDEALRKGEIRVVLTKAGPRPPLARTLSAPSQQGTTPPQQPQPPQQPPQQNQQTPKNVKIAPQRRLNQPAVSMDVIGPNDDDDDDLAALRDRIKSAPTRRKLKTAAARRKNKDKTTESSEDEKEVKETEKNRKTTRRRQMVKNGGDIVTMVSLVSPATSDAEDSVVQVPEGVWLEEKEEGPTGQSPAPPSPEEPPRDATSFFIQKFVSLRKTTKTVSFQQNPPINRSYSASFPSRRVPAGAPIIIPTPAPSQVEKRPPVGVVVGADNRGVKRRLVRTRSAPIKDDDDGSSDDTSKTDTSTEPVAESPPRRREDETESEGEDKGEDDPNREPEFKSPKERECWTLYRKMLEKGVSVSYDTVLRGMLTPTEYRLRKNQLLSSC